VTNEKVSPSLQESLGKQSVERKKLEKRWKSA